MPAKRSDPAVSRPAVRQGHVRLVPPPGVIGCSVSGVEYRVTDGAVDVLDAHAETLCAIGFAPVAPDV